MELKQPRCGRCRSNLARYKVWVKQSHPLSEIRVTMKLCPDCYEDFKKMKIDMEILEEF